MRSYRARDFVRLRRAGSETWKDAKTFTEVHFEVAVTPFPLFKRPTDRRRVEVPRDTPAFKALWDEENRVFLIVPDDFLPHTKKQEKKRTE